MDSKMSYREQYFDDSHLTHLYTIDEFCEYNDMTAQDKDDVKILLTSYFSHCDGNQTLLLLSSNSKKGGKLSRILKGRTISDALSDPSTWRARLLVKCRTQLTSVSELMFANAIDSRSLTLPMESYKQNSDLLKVYYRDGESFQILRKLFDLPKEPTWFSTNHQKSLRTLSELWTETPPLLNNWPESLLPSNLYRSTTFPTDKTLKEKSDVFVSIMKLPELDQADYQPILNMHHQVLPQILLGCTSYYCKSMFDNWTVCLYTFVTTRPELKDSIRDTLLYS